MVELEDNTFLELNVSDMLKVQGMPHTCRFPKSCSRSSKQCMIGNAVPPPMARAVLERLANYLHTAYQ